jgi:hypothetical protein
MGSFRLQREHLAAKKKSHAARGRNRRARTHMCTHMKTDRSPLATADAIQDIGISSLSRIAGGCNGCGRHGGLSYSSVGGSIDQK